MAIVPINSIRLIPLIFRLLKNKIIDNINKASENPIVIFGTIKPTSAIKFIIIILINSPLMYHFDELAFEFKYSGKNKMEPSMPTKPKNGSKPFDRGLSILK
jgi:hypothetical protein